MSIEEYDHLKQLQPSLLANDRVYIKRQRHTGDFDTVHYEGRLGGFNRERPWESCTVLGGLWSWSASAATYDGETPRPYLDGEPLTAGAKIRLTIAAANRPFGPGPGFRGVVDDGRLSDRALSPEEVAALATATTPAE